MLGKRAQFAGYIDGLSIAEVDVKHIDSAI